MLKSLKPYIELAKLRIVSMVLVTTTIGFFLGGKGIDSFMLLFFTLMGTGYAAAGAAALNNYLERDTDAMMNRTKTRVLPAGKLEASSALAFGVCAVLLGVMILVYKVNLLAAFIVLLTDFLYVLVYTPLKRVSWLNTTIGAIPGALPPMTGWAAATGDVSLGAWVLFGILFAWQHPHFYAIAWMYRDDYARADFKMLPVVEPSGRRMFRHVILYSVVLIGISVMPAFIGMTGNVYLYGALTLGIFLMWSGTLLARKKSLLTARGLLRASVYYLPILLVLIVIDAGF